MHDGIEDLLKLRELPELQPPPGVWERVLEAERARAEARRAWRRGAALAAVMAVVAMTGGVAAYFLNATETTSASGTTSYAALVAESARLEQVLAQLPAPRPLMAGSTASTIVGLEDRIAFVDTQLSYAAAEDVAAPYRQALWGERVELMNALVYVRFAQAQ
jgi:hypothetical protein